MCQKRNKLTEQILHCRSELSKICPAVLVQSIRAKILPFMVANLCFQPSC